WVRTYAGSLGTHDAGVIVRVTSAGYVYVVGSVANNITNLLDITLLKYSPTGTLLWVYSYENPGIDIPTDLIIKSTSVYISGGVQNGSNPNSQNFAIIKLDTTGTLEWATEYGNGLRNIASVLLEENNGMVVTAGLSDRNIDTTDVFYLAIDTIDGTVLDSQRFFVDYDITQIGGFAHYTNGSYILVGTLDNDGQTDGFIQRLAHDFVFDNGIEPWFATFGDTLNDQATSVTVDDQQRIFVGANIGKGGGKYDGKIYVFTSPTDSTGTPIDTIDIPHPDPSKNLEIQKLVWNNQGQKLHIGGTIENEQGKNDIMIARQNQGLSLDYIKSTPTLANTKRLTN
ncbi:MAG TPA: hypothetical protein PKH93_14655, partial [Chitinophagales bacterium]|nr:hypothetical protein [Chitinophagales bacterium]